MTRKELADRLNSVEKSLVFLSVHDLVTDSEKAKIRKRMDKMFNNFKEVTHEP